MSIRHGYTNATRIDGERVFKRYLGIDAVERMRAEVEAIQRTAGRVPAPEILHIERAHCEVTFRFLPGLHGQDLIDGGHADRVLEAAGRRRPRVVEWIVRMHHEAAATSLGYLFQGWGEQPTWDRRQAAMLAACRRFRDRAEHLRDRPAAVLWSERADITSRWRG